MKNTISLILILFCLESYSQSTIYSDLKDSVKRDWILPNPVFTKTKSSFFNKENSQKYFISPIQISGYSIPFTWDCDLSMLKFLTVNDPKFKIIKGKEADEIYQGTKLKWEKPISVLIWIKNQIYKSQVDHWILFEKTECPETITFPSLNFKKIFDLENAYTNKLEGLVIIPYSKDISYIHRYAIKLKTTDSKKIEGIAFDINKDKIPDIFIFYENLNKEGSKGYTRLYINIEGKWICKWIELFEVCI